MTPKDKHPEDDPLNPFNKGMWDDQNIQHERTDGDAMFGALLKAQDELDNPDQNIAGLARHEQGPDGKAPLQEPSKSDLPNPTETSSGVSTTSADKSVALGYFRRLFRKQ